MKNLSYWEENTFFSKIDFAIIGSGIVGLNCAIHLKKKFPSKKVVVFERGLLPSGASTKNAGFACFGSLSEILEDLKMMPENDVLELIKKRWNGLQYLKELLGVQQMDYQENSSYELFLEDEIKIFEDCFSNIEKVNTILKSFIGEKVFENADKMIYHFGFNHVNHIIKNNFEGQIDTGKMMHNLLLLANSLGVIVLNGMELKKWEEHNNHVEICINQKYIEVEKLIFCTNGFTNLLLPNLDLKPARAQVLITSPIKNLEVKGTFHYQKGYYYFRNIHNRILIGGGRNLDFEGETTTEISTTKFIQDRLEKMLQDIIIPNNDFTIDKRWAGIMGVGSTKKAIVKKISDRTSCAIRLGGMGVAIGALIGKEVGEINY